MELQKPGLELTLSVVYTTNHDVPSSSCTAHTCLTLTKILHSQQPQDNSLHRKRA